MDKFLIVWCLGAGTMKYGIDLYRACRLNSGYENPKTLGVEGSSALVMTMNLNV